MKEIEVEIDKYDSQYRGRGRVNKTTCVVMGAAPGELIRGRIIGKSRGRLVVNPVEILRASEHRVEPKCRHFGECAGCQFQQLHYDEQLELKRKRLDQFMRRFKEFETYPFEEIIGSEEIYGYRNNITLHGPGEPGFWKVEGVEMLKIEDCPVCVEEIRTALKEHRERGFGKLVARGVDNVLLRASSTGEIYVGPEQISDEDNVWLSEVISHPLTGGEVELIVPSHGFWQGNTPTISTLVSEVCQDVKRFNPDQLVEAYAGMGLFSIFLAEIVENITCIEVNELSVAAGRKNLRRLNLDQIEFNQGKTEEEILHELWQLPAEKGTLLVDPPRSGMPGNTMNAILSHPPEQLIYVSCNPESLSRNLHKLCREIYTINRLRGLDLFPHTKHLELICDLRRVR